MTLDRIAKLLPLGAALLIGLGVLKTSIYYNYFGVDIMTYLSTSEVVTLFLNDYVSILTLIILATIHILISDHVIYKVDSAFGTDFFEDLIRKHKWKFFLFFLIVVLITSCVFIFSTLQMTDLELLHLSGQ